MFIRRALDELTPKSPLWSLGLEVAAKAIARVGDSPEYNTYGSAMADHLPEEIRPQALMWLFIAMKEVRKDDAVADAFLARLNHEFPNAPATKFLNAQFGKSRVVAAGKRVPQFPAPSLEDPRRRYTQADIWAKVYLIDFWPTWCAPCVGEMPVLHRAYERFKSKGFEILSYSADTNAEVVRAFRAERFPMPWLHSIDPEGKALESETAKLFEVRSLPRAMLIDSSGTILAADDDVRGEKLEKMLRLKFAVARARTPFSAPCCASRAFGSGRRTLGSHAPRAGRSAGPSCARRGVAARTSRRL